MFIFAHGEPAGGAPTQDLIGAAIAGLLGTAAVAAVAIAHRRGRFTLLTKAAKLSERVSGLPGWAALPSFICGQALVIAVFGFYWDVATHIDDGRDAGPFANTSHFFILAGLAGIALAGFIGILLGCDEDNKACVRIRDGWHAPVGAVLIFLCGAVALTGFPLDDVWHRLFGQDVTLWGPTHILMVGGASLSTLGIWVLISEGRRSQDPARRAHESPLVYRLRVAAMAGGFLLGLSALQAEFDYGVPQFRLLYQPVMIMLAAGIGLVTARAWLGRGGALQAVAFFLLLRGLLTLIIGPGFTHTTLHFPLYVAEALIVEAVALRVPRGRPVALGAWSGAGIGTIGLAAEWGWSHVWMPNPWPASLLPEAAILGFLAAVAGGVLGGYLARNLDTEDQLAGERLPRWLAPAAGAVVVLCLAWPLPMNDGDDVRARIALTEVEGTRDGREVQATLRFDPADAAANADWLTVIAWQGGGSVQDRLENVAPGVYRTSEPIPVYGEWKAMVRLADGRAVTAAPIFLPADEAIPVSGVPATRNMDRPLVRDSKILRREETGGSPALKALAYGVLLTVVVVWIAAMVAGLRRLGSGATSQRRRPPRPPRVRARVAPAGP